MELHLKVFISSLIVGMEDLRTAAATAVQALGHEAVRAEDFQAAASSPQKACLSAVRVSDVVVLLLGSRYGAVQASGLSATHEEFREACDRCPVFAFVQEGISAESRQADFIKEARDWQSGGLTTGFSSPQQLQQRVTTALHRWELGRASGTADAAEMISRADSLLEHERRGYGGGVTSVALTVSGGPHQLVLRPSDLEAPKLREELHQMALFGQTRLFVPEEGVKPAFEGDALVLRQKEASVLVNGEGSISLVLPLTEGRDGISAIIEENVTETIAKGLGFAAAVLDKIDPVERITHVAAAVCMREAKLSWMAYAP